MTSARKAPSGITQREREIMDCLLRTGINKLVANELCISGKTLDNALSSIRKKMGVDNRVHMVLQWDRQHRSTQ